MHRAQLLTFRPALLSSRLRPTAPTSCSRSARLPIATSKCVCTESLFFALTSLTSETRPQYPIPICIDEWSLYTGVKDQTFEKQFYEQQLVTWAWSAGGMYWSWKLETSQQDLAAGLDYSQYSFCESAFACFLVTLSSLNDVLCQLRS